MNVLIACEELQKLWQNNGGEIMLHLIVMFILGVIFASCCWACVLVHSWNGIKDLTDDELQEMEKWYRENYEENQ